MDQQDHVKGIISNGSLVHREKEHMCVCLLSLTLPLSSLLFLTYLLFLQFRIFFFFFISSFMCSHLPRTFLDAFCHYFFFCSATGTEVFRKFVLHLQFCACGLYYIFGDKIDASFSECQSLHSSLNMSRVV